MHACPMTSLPLNKQGKCEEWTLALFRLPSSYRLDFAVCIYVYTMEDPALYKIINNAMHNPARRSAGSVGGVSSELGACPASLARASTHKTRQRYTFLACVCASAHMCVFIVPLTPSPSAIHSPGECMPFVKYLDTALRLLPPEYIVTSGKVRRGVRWVRAQICTCMHPRTQKH